MRTRSTDRPSPSSHRRPGPAALALLTWWWLGAGSVRAASAQPRDEPVADRAHTEVLPRKRSVYDFQLAAAGFDQSWRIAKGVYGGVGGMLGSPLYRLQLLDGRDVELDPTIEAVSATAFLRFTPWPAVDVDLGGRAVFAASPVDVSPGPRGAFAPGGYLDIRVGSAHVRFGPRAEYQVLLYGDFHRRGWKLTPLLVRAEL